VTDNIPTTQGRRTALVAILCIALAKLALNLGFAGRYGYFRDELYYIACSNHLAWGYVDQPPLSILILKATLWLLGDSLYAIRFPAALAGSACVVLTGLIARKLGGGRFAQVLAALAAALSPVVLANAARYFTMNAFDLLFWALGSYVLLSIILDHNERLWVVYGLVAGLGVMNKYSVLFFGLGTVAGVLLTAQRRSLLRPWIWIGGALAAIIVLPHALWEIRLGFPSSEFIHNASTLKNAPVTAVDFFVSQAFMTGFGQTLLWIAGLGFFFLGARARSLRMFAWLYPIVAVVMFAGHSKPYYLTPIYFPYLAAGAVVFEGFARRPRLAWFGHAVVALVVVLSLLMLPFAVPVLPVDSFIRYEKALGRSPKSEERQPLSDLPQSYADMFGWEDMVARVAEVYRSLTPEEQKHCVIFARNYGEAGAIDFFGRHYGLPHAISPHNSYWYWGTGDDAMQVAIVFGQTASLEENLADLQGPGRFEMARLATTTECRHCMPYENHRMIFLCRGPRFTFAQIWPREKEFI
jgi:4-amino-4-deoxy-L-arabinose transferase-like glycosyltransferase